MLVKENTNYKSMNNWYASLRKNKKEDMRQSNFIERSSGKSQNRNL